MASSSVDAPGSVQAPDGPPSESVVRYRKRSLYLLALYLPFAIIPWVLTCIIDVRPINHPSYINQTGFYTLEDLTRTTDVASAIRILNSINSLITVPLVSSLLAHAVIVYTQRRRVTQALNIQQTFALADRAWSDWWSILLSIVGSTSARANRSYFLLIAAGVLLLSSVQQPIQSLLVSPKDILLVTCLDNPLYPGFNCKVRLGDVLPVSIGLDPEPAALNSIPQSIVVQEIVSNVVTGSSTDLQPNLWPEPDHCDYDTETSNRNSLSWYFNGTSPCGGAPPTFFVSALPNQTITGVLRQHSMRLNSSIQCTAIARSEFPSACIGSRPFTANFSVHGADYPEAEGSFALSSRICVPGDYSKGAWSLSRDRQDISETIYVEITQNTSHPSLSPSVTTQYSGMHCTSNTTRGYFELGNYQNNFNYQPLLTSWPSKEVMEVDFNDYLPWSATIESPSTNDTDTSVDTFEASENLWQTPIDPLNTMNSETLPIPFRTPGPLMTSAIALFGNYSFFNFTSTLASANILNSSSSSPSIHSALSQLCQPNVFPFQRYNSTLVSNGDTDEYSPQTQCNNILPILAGTLTGQVPIQSFVLIMLQEFLDFFTVNPATAEMLLSASVFYANQAYLTQTANANNPKEGYFTARNIYTSPGTTFTKPSKSFASTILISVLLGLQLVSLTLLVLYIYSVPTWNTALDALAVARLVANMPQEDFTALSQENGREVRQLRDVDGLVGVGDDGAMGLGQMGLVKRNIGRKTEKERDNGPAGQEETSSSLL